MKNAIILSFVSGLGISPIYAQTYQWAKNMGGNSDDCGKFIALDDSGNVYTTGSFYGTVDFDPGPGTSNLTSAGSSDIFICKMDAAGNLIWAIGIGGTGNDQGNSIAIDDSGYVHSTGYFQGAVDFDPGVGLHILGAGQSAVFISKLDSEGNFVWAKNISGLAWDQVSYGSSLTLDGSGNVYTIGSFKGIADFDPGVATNYLTSAGLEDIFILKLDAAGNFNWATSIGDTNQDIGLSIKMGGSGKIYCTGIYQGTCDFDPGAGTSNLSSAGPFDIFILKLDAVGNFGWAKGLGSAGADAGSSIFIDAFENVYVTGEFGGTVDFDPGAGTSILTSKGKGDIFILKLDASGNFRWSKGIGGTEWDWGRSIVVDGSGNTYITGHFSLTADFDPGAATYNLVSSGVGDIFIIKLDAAGNFVWAKSMGGADWDEGFSIAVNGSGDVYATGWFWGTIDFDPGAETSNLTSEGGGTFSFPNGRQLL